jgi:hypothetical protein
MTVTNVALGQKLTSAKGREKGLDSGACQHNDVRPDGRGHATNLNPEFTGFGIALGPNFTGLF